MSTSNLTIITAHQLITSGKISPTELVEGCIKQIKNTDRNINATITLLEQQALLQAKETEQRLADGESLGVLDGIPLSLKDVVCTKGIRTTACSHILENFVPPYDATVTTRLKNKGAVIISKVNTDEFTCGGSSETSAFGVTKNPWDLTKVAGGSSGGSAASVTAGHCLGSIGTDTGGSIRLPAAFCNVTGLKVTYGRVSRFGVISMASSLDSIGPLARSAEDCAHILEHIAGHDVRDSTTPQTPVLNYSQEVKKPLEKYRIGIPQEYFAEGLSSETKAAVEKAAQQFEALGCTLVPISLPHTRYGVAVYYVLAPAEVSSNMSRYDGIRFGPGPKETASSLEDYYLKAREEGFGDEMKRRITIGSHVLSSGYYDAYYRKAQQVRTLISQDFSQAFENVDLILSPVCPFNAFEIGSKTADPLQMYLADSLLTPSALAGIPGLSLPCGFDSTDLPIGLQLLAPAFHEARVLHAGYHYQQHTNFHLESPSLTK